MEEQKPDERKTENIERDIISVAYKSKSHIVFMGLFLSLALLAIIFVVMDGLKKSQPQSLIENEEIAFRHPNAHATPYIDEGAFKKEDAPKSAPANTDPARKDTDIALQKELLRLLSEEEKKRQARRQSPQLIYDQPSIATQYSTSHLEEVALNHTYDTEKPTQLKNLSTLIPQGTMISGILETAIQSDLAGMVRAIVSENIYSFDSSSLLIPKGSKLIGRYRSGISKGQTRLFVIWNRLITNNGQSITLDSIGTDPLGRTGIKGDVNTHFFERFGSSMLLSLIDASLQIGGKAVDNTNTAAITLQTGNDFSKASEIALKNSIDIPPTLHIDQGTRIKVFVGQDLDFSYANRN